MTVTIFENYIYIYIINNRGLESRLRKMVCSGTLLTIRICLDKLYSLPDPPQLPRSVVKDLLQFATKKSHFLFDGQFYYHINGVAMGSPLGPILANIFMCHFEEKWLTKSRFCPSLWFRYVDDTFTMFDSKDNANEFLSFLNSRHDSIKFTIEFEEDNKIPFLDILLKRCPDNTFSTSVYRKKTFTGHYTKWDSFTSRKYKLNLIRTLTYRCFRICSSPSLLQAAIKDLKTETPVAKRLPSRCYHVQHKRCIEQKQKQTK